MTDAFRQSAMEILDWAETYVRPYTQGWDEGKKATEFLEHLKKFKENM